MCGGGGGVSFCLQKRKILGDVVECMCVCVCVWGGGGGGRGRNNFQKIHF